MRKSVIISVMLLGFSGAVRGQSPTNPAINPDLFTKRWSAQWIAPPGVSLKDYGVYHFRRTIDLPKVPATFVVHVSADNRYQLFVNGELVSLGPARGDVNHWNFETVDLARL